ncbi:hypothetical protein PS15m_004910 [Mucor circinelloides]
MGSVQYRSFRRQDNQLVTKVRLVATGSGCYPHGCIYDDLEESRVALRKSTLEESNLSGTTKNPNRTDSIHRPCCGPVLAQQRNLVFYSEGSGSMPSSDTGQTSGSNDFSNEDTSPATEQLDALRLEVIRNRIDALGLNSSATQDLLHQHLHPSATLKSCYRKHQLRFLDFALKHQVSLDRFITPKDVVNFLAFMRDTQQHQTLTLKTARVAITHLHHDPSSIHNSLLINSYIDSLAKLDPPALTHRPPIDVSPALTFARSIAAHSATSIKLLQQKLVFLLAMAAFLRPSDLAQIPFDSCSISDTGCLLFQVVAPKETRGKRRIIKPFTIHSHATDGELCPVQCFKALRDHPALSSRPSGSKLFVKSNNIHQALSASSTMSSWLHPSSRALDLGVSRENIVALGNNWASSDTFINHYQRNHMAQIDFTSTVLSEPTDEFYDASTDFPLN